MNNCIPDKEWTETTSEFFYYSLEVLPPAAMQGHSFMVGEPFCHGEHGAIHTAFTEIKGRYFHKDDYLKHFNSIRYQQEVSEQFDVHW